MDPGSLSSDPVNGTVLTGFTGSNGDFTLFTPSGLPILRVPSGTQNLVLLGALSVATGITFPGVGAGFVKSDGFGVFTGVPSITLSDPEVTGILPVSKGGTGLATINTDAILVGNGAGNLVASNLFYLSNTLTVGGFLTINAVSLTSTGQIIAPASTASAASIRFSPGVAPTTPVDGDIWFTSLGVFARVNGVTRGPLLFNVNLAGLDVTGILPIANGGTGQNTANGALNALLPTQAGNSGRVLFTDGSNSSWQTPGGYSVTSNSAQFTPVNNTTYYFGIFASLPVTTTPDIRRQYIPKSGTIRAASLSWRADATAGTGESVSIYIRVNNTTDYLLATVSNSNAQKVFLNTALNIPVVAGDYIEMKLVTPVWTTNPTQVSIGGTVYIE